MNHVMEYLNQITASSFSIFGMIFLGLALLNCFLGYRLKKLWISMIGFLLGIAIGAGITALFSENKTVILAAGLVVGILVALLSFRLYLIGVFFYAVLSAYPLIAGLIGKELWWEIALSVIAALLIGLLAVNFVRPVLIIVSAVGGGMQVSQIIMGWIAMENLWGLYGVAAGLALLGMLVQFRSSKE
ncbi:hypothetical protein LKD81_10595 [Lachnospiraceae bacterium CLA-AA-H215]|uniref:DUF4203 domain-containing protein n=1 Tax=Hominifimenecus microfluidus TaxID=2885348 RepID=A0AAE3ECM8_9FIRM|nr:hypothetical protein [Hominifimenecus microfluidus]MCC2231440.1 hypothetical protein [Hominifimenecus microfluidus]